MTKATNPYFWFSGLRAWASWSVIVYHLNQYRPTANLANWNWELYRFTETWTVAVSFFFILTGAGISLRFWSAIFGNTPAPPAKKSFWDRLWRIAPVYWIVLIISFFYAAALHPVTSESILRLVSGIVFLNWMHPVTFFPVDLNGSLWYLSFDIMGAILVFGTMSILARVRKVFIPLYFWGICGLLILGHLAFSQIPFPTIPGIMSEWFPVYNPFIFGLHFMIGVLVGAGLTWGVQKIGKSSYLWDMAWLILLWQFTKYLWDLRILGDFEKSWLGTPFHFPEAPLFIAGLILFLPFTRCLASIFEAYIFRFSAKISYSVYLWHALVIVVLKEHIFINSSLVLEEWLKLSVVSIVITIAIATASQAILEQRLTKWGLEIWERGKVWWKLRW